MHSMKFAAGAVLVISAALSGCTKDVTCEHTATCAPDAKASGASGEPEDASGGVGSSGDDGGTAGSGDGSSGSGDGGGSSGSGSGSSDGGVSGGGNGGSNGGSGSGSDGGVSGGGGGETLPCVPGEPGCESCAVTLDGEDNVGCDDPLPLCVTPELAWESMQAALGSDDGGDAATTSDAGTSDAGADASVHDAGEAESGEAESGQTESSATPARPDDLVAATGVPAGGLCVECVTHDDCQDGVCAGYECVPCLPGDGTATSSAPDLGCGAATPLCSDASDATDRACDCTSSAQCDDSDKPFCSNNGCTGCTTDSQCATRAALTHDGAAVCNEGTGRCEACTSDAECTSDDAAQCDLATFTCVPCTSDDHCASVPGKGVCGPDALCVECVDGGDEDACGAYSCNAKTFECTETAKESLALCTECTADSECKGGSAPARCVPMTFQGEPREQAYCLQEQGTVVCPERFAVQFDGVSLSGVSARYCGIHQNDSVATSCEAIRDSIESTVCTTDADCDSEHGAICINIDVDKNACTYPCVDIDDCKSGYICDTIAGLGSDTLYCQPQP